MIASMQGPKEKLIVFDTTLRDGEQSPGVSLTIEEKVEIAHQLSRLGVDVCEAGFPISCDGEFEAVKRIAIEVGPVILARDKPMVIAALARTTTNDIRRAYDAVKYAPLHRIHVFLATSDIHLKYKLKISREECIARAVAAVLFAKSLGVSDIEFSPEDAGRSDLQFLCYVLSAVIEAGATTINIPDTVGYNLPEDYGAMMRSLIANVPGSSSVVWSCHCHNDLGLATANTLAGIMNGARQAEVTINGIGERAGNTALEEVTMAIQTHPNAFPVHHTIKTKLIYHTSQLVTKRTGMTIQPNKAIVGANAFSHESGIHQDGFLKNKLTYEIIQPEMIGLSSKQLVLGKLSGRHAFKAKIDEMLVESPYAKLEVENESFEALFNRFKALAMSKKDVVEDDLVALLDEHFQICMNGAVSFELVNVQIVTGTGMQSKVTVAVLDKRTDVVLNSAALGNGPIDALFSALNRIIGMGKSNLVSYEVSAVTGGVDALGRVMVRVKGDDGRVSMGRGVDVDILVSSTKAYLDAVNKMLGSMQMRKAAEQD